LIGIVGTAGASDQNNISVGQAVVSGMVSVLLIGVGVAGHNFAECREESGYVEPLYKVPKQKP